MQKIKKKIYFKKFNKLRFGSFRSSGRSRGTICTYHRGGGYKKLFKVINFIKSFWNMFGIVVKLLYDSKRTSLVMLVKLTNNCLLYDLAPDGLQLNSRIYYGCNNLIIRNRLKLNGLGDTRYIRSISSGLFISMLFFRKSKLVGLGRSAGMRLKLISQFLNQNTCTVKFTKIEKLWTLSSWNLAVIGLLARKMRKISFYKKAGSTRHLGRRPIVRGVAMNPIDHPHGGGQGKTSGGRPSVTPWGYITKGRKTKNLRIL